MLRTSQSLRCLVRRMRDLEPASCNAEAFASHISARSLSSAAHFQHPDDIVGEISPITRSLWFERARLNQHSLEDSRLPEPVVKPPHLTSVTYGFATDAGLREQVSGAEHMRALCADAASKT